MICCSLSIGSRVTIAIPSTTLTMLSAGATSFGCHPREIALDQCAPLPTTIGRRTTAPASVGCGCT